MDYASPFRIEDGLGPICIVDADGRVVLDYLTTEEAEEKLEEQQWTS